MSSPAHTDGLDRRLRGVTTDNGRGREARLDNATYLTTALAVLRDHPPGLDYRAAASLEAPDRRMPTLFGGLEWSEPARLPKVLGREFQEVLAAYLARIGARRSLPETVLSASPYGDVTDQELRRRLVDAADEALSHPG